jgi:hypothetical protein
MFGSVILDVIVGLFFVFAVFSALCSAVREFLESFLKNRAANLEFGLRQLLSDPGGGGMVKALYDHPLVYGLFAGKYQVGPAAKPGVFTSGGDLPSYIPSRTVAVALLDGAGRGAVPVPGLGAAGAGAVPGPAGPLTIDSLRAALAQVPDGRIQRLLTCAIDNARGDIDAVVTNLEKWFDSGMDRISGWYKRATDRIIFCVALLLAGILNIDALAIADHLYRNTSARDAIKVRVDSYLEHRPAHADPQAWLGELTALDLPIGWSATERAKFCLGPAGGGGAETRAAASAATSAAPGAMPSPVRADPAIAAARDSGCEPSGFSVAGRFLGMLITALSATLGAPFWFDLLNKVMVIRSTVKPHEKSPEEPSQG